MNENYEIIIAIVFIITFSCFFSLFMEYVDLKRQKSEADRNNRDFRESDGE